MPDIAFAVNKLAKYSNNLGVVHYGALLHLIGYIQGKSYKFLKLYSNMKDAHIYKILRKNNITLNEDTIMTFPHTPWNEYVDIDRSTGCIISTMQG